MSPWLLYPIVSLLTLVALLGLALLLSVPSHLGTVGRRVRDWLGYAPLLDLIVAGFTWIPWLVGGVALGWGGLLAVLVGQVLAFHGWVFAHEWLHRQAVQGPRIVKFINGRFGLWRNHLALWVTIVALPGFWIIRLLQVLCYPFLIWLLSFPRYHHADWVNVSRHKFDGLVGHDLIWCLYCDWMTGVFSLGAEMLRNVESFWCPIRFDDTKKCENCRVDFPDIDNGWVRADGTMHEVQQRLEQMYPPGQSSAWFGHPARLTIEGQPTHDPAEPAEPSTPDDGQQP